MVSICACARACVCACVNRCVCQRTTPTALALTATPRWPQSTSDLKATHARGCVRHEGGKGRGCVRAVLRPEGNARAWVCACEVQAHHHEGGKGRVCVRATANQKRQRSCVRRATAETKSDRFFLHLAPNSAHGVLRGARAVHRHQVTPRESRNSRRNWERAVAWTDRLDTQTHRHTDRQTDRQTG